MEIENRRHTCVKIILITGGQRSGKSVYAEQMALSLSENCQIDGAKKANPVYLATARIWDDEFRERVQKHKDRRGPQWSNIEEEKFISRHDVSNRVVLVDCLTLWATNYFFDAGAGSETGGEEQVPSVENVLEQIKNEFDALVQQDATFIFVTNEIGLGGTSANMLQRRFTDLLGALNQYVASKADNVILMVSGIPVKIK